MTPPTANVRGIGPDGYRLADSGTRMATGMLVAALLARTVNPLDMRAVLVPAERAERRHPAAPEHLCGLSHPGCLDPWCDEHWCRRRRRHGGWHSAYDRDTGA